MLWFFLSVILIVIIAILTPFGKDKWAKGNKPEKAIYLLLIASAIVGAIIKLKEYRREQLIERVKARIGTFSGLNQVKYLSLVAGPDDNCSVRWLEENTQILFGGIISNMINIYTLNGKLTVDAIVSNLHGKPIAVISENEWEVFDDDYEYNNDEHGFELVTKGYRKVYFHVYIQSDIIHILGIVNDETGTGWKFVGCNNDKQAIAIVKVSPSMPELYAVIDGAIFKYPRDTHLGERKK